MELCSQAVCVQNFHGTSLPGSWPVAYWADWCPVDGRVYFGGDWHEVPAMPSPEMPSEEEWGQWVEDHIA